MAPPLHTVNLLHCDFHQQWAQFRVQYTGHARPVVSEALGLVALDAAAAAALPVPLANRNPTAPPAVAVDLPCDVCGAICSVLT